MNDEYQKLQDYCKKHSRTCPFDHIVLKYISTREKFDFRELFSLLEERLKYFAPYGCEWGLWPEGKPVDAEDHYKTLTLNDDFTVTGHFYSGYSGLNDRIASIVKKIIEFLEFIGFVAERPKSDDAFKFMQVWIRPEYPHYANSTPHLYVSRIHTT